MKIQFFYVTGHSFTANNVVSYGEDAEDAGIIIYETETFKGDIRTVATHEVPTFDLLFAVVTPQNGELPQEGEIHTTTIIHGRAGKFDIAVAAKQMAEIIGEAHAEAIEDNDFMEWKKVEEVKYRARQKRRHLEASAAQAELDERTTEQRVADDFNKEVDDLLPLVKKVVQHSTK